MPDFRKLLDKAKELAGQHPSQADQGIEKAGEFADQKTGGRYSDQIQQGEQRSRDYLGTGGQGGGQQAQDPGGQQAQDQGGQQAQDPSGQQAQDQGGQQAQDQGGYGNQ